MRATEYSHKDARNTKISGSKFDAPGRSARPGSATRARVTGLQRVADPLRARKLDLLSLKPRMGTLIIWLLILAFAVTFATLSLRRHAALATNGMDLGNVDQALWNTAQGEFLAFTNMAPIRNRLALHVEPILLLCVPFYWIGVGGPRLLLLVQAVVVGLGALPLYWLAQEVLVGGGEAEEREGRIAYYVLRIAYCVAPVVFALAYLLFPALEAAVMYDFHAVTLAPTFLLFAVYFVERGRPGLFALFAALAMSCKEDMGLTVAMLGLYIMITQRRWRWGGLTTLAGTAWFAIAVFLIQPQFSPTGGNIQAGRYAWLGETPLDMAKTLVGRPDLVWDRLGGRADLPGYLGGLLIPTAFLSLLAPLAWLPALPSLAINLLSDNPFTWRLEDFHYAAPIVPFVLVATVYGARRLADWAGHRSGKGRGYGLWAACGLLLVASSVYHYARGYSPLAQPFQPWTVTEHHRRAGTVFAQVPESAALFVQGNLNPHLSSRRVLYQDPALLTDPALGEDLPAPDYYLFDVSSLVNQNDFHRFIASELLESGDFGPALAEDGFLLLERGAPRPLPDEFFDFARSKSVAMSYPLTADFGDALRLHGFDLRFNRAEEVEPVLYFEALRPLDEDYLIALYLLDRWGAPSGATPEDQPALAWYPTRRWQPGETIKVAFNTFPWYTRDMPAYRLAFGVMRGRDVWEPGARLSPSLESESESIYAVRLPDGGTLLELARFRQVSVLGITAARPAGGPLKREFSPSRLETTVDISLGGEARLLGYEMALAGPASGAGCMGAGIEGTEEGSCRLELVLHWQAERVMDTDYTVFVHVLGPDGKIWAQRDAPPDGGGYPTGRWAAGEVVADPVLIPLPAEAPLGSLDVVVGMYRPDTGERLPVLNGRGQPVDDKIVLEQLKLAVR